MERPSELREICQAGKLNEPAWYVVHRRLSIYVTWALLHTPVTPNHVTAAMMVLAVVGAALLAFQSLTVNLAGFALLYVSFILDKVDGEIARYRGVESPRAILLDRFHHLAIEPAVLFAAAWRQFSIDHQPSVLIAALVAIVVGNIIEEQPHLAPYALIKHLRDVGHFPRSTGPRARSVVDVLYPIFRSLKVFRMFIMVVPSLLLAYVTQSITGAPLVSAFLFVAVAALSVYLAFQTAWYYDIKLEGEIASMRGFFRADVLDEASRLRENASDAVVVFPGPESSREWKEGRTVGPRTVSGVSRHENPSRVARDLTS